MENQITLIGQIEGLPESLQFKVIPSNGAPEFKPATREEANLCVLGKFVNLNFVYEISTQPSG
jgi:hypothetical protein